MAMMWMEQRRERKTGEKERGERKGLVFLLLFSLRGEASQLRSRGKKEQANCPHITPESGRGNDEAVF